MCPTTVGRNGCFSKDLIFIPITLVEVDHTFLLHYYLIANAYFRSLILKRRTYIGSCRLHGRVFQKKSIDISTVQGLRP